MKYAVSFTIHKITSQGLQITSIVLEIVDAMNKEEAIGKVLGDFKQDFLIGAYKVKPIQDDITKENFRVG